jgi:hypothetical protein
MHVDVKVSVWKRFELPECASKKEVIKKLQLGEEGINYLFDYFDNLDYNEVDNSEETLDPEDNGGQETIELYCNEERGDGPVWTNKLKIPKPVEKPSTYFLFGDDSCKILNDEGFGALCKAIRDDGLSFSIHKFPDGGNALDLLAQHDGWYDYAIITKRQYNKLTEL